MPPNTDYCDSLHAPLPDLTDYIPYTPLNAKKKPAWLKDASGELVKNEFNGYQGQVKSCKEFQTRHGEGKQFYKNGVIAWGLFKDNVFEKGTVIRL